jgi:hypothetical protein
MQAQLDDFASTILDANGNGTARIGPRSSRQQWQVNNVAVYTSSTVNVPTATAYTGTPSPGSSLGGTYDGNNDSTGVSVTLYPGQQLSVQWLGGDPGASATVSVYGTISQWGD